MTASCMLLKLTPSHWDLKYYHQNTSIYRGMLSRADVIVENYRPGVMAKLGLSWNDLHHEFPHLIMVRNG